MPHFAAAPVLTERLRLRPVCARDADAIYAGLCDWDVTRMLAMPPWPYTRADAEAFVIKVAERGERSTIWTLAVTRPQEDWLMGCVGGHRGERGEHVGYWLAQRYWSRGYMTEAVRAVLSRLFADLPDTVVRSGVYEDNPASLHVQNKLGFKVVGSHLAFCRPRGIDVRHIDTRLTRARFSKAISS